MLRERSGPVLKEDNDRAASSGLCKLSVQQVHEWLPAVLGVTKPWETLCQKWSCNEARAITSWIHVQVRNDCSILDLMPPQEHLLVPACPVVMFTSSRCHSCLRVRSNLKSWHSSYVLKNIVSPFSFTFALEFSFLRNPLDVWHLTWGPLCLTTEPGNSSWGADPSLGNQCCLPSNRSEIPFVEDPDFSEISFWDV